MPTTYFYYMFLVFITFISLRLGAVSLNYVCDDLGRLFDFRGASPLSRHPTAAVDS